MTAVQIRVQHAPGREAALDRLLASLGVPAVIVTDHGGGTPSPWRGYKACLSNIPDKFSHILIAQDDTIACRNLAAALPLVADAHPDKVICLFLGGAPRRTAALARKAHAASQHFTRLHPNDFLPVVATMWPREKAEHFLTWAEENPMKLGHREPRSDDAVAGRWMKFNREQVVCTVPSLVQHPDDHPSTIGRKHSAGADSQRVAALWDPEFDPLAVDWTARSRVLALR